MKNASPAVPVFQPGDRVSFLGYEVFERDGRRVVSDRRRRMTGTVESFEVQTHPSHAVFYNVKLDPDQSLNSHASSVMEVRDKMRSLGS